MSLYDLSRARAESDAKAWQIKFEIAHQSLGIALEECERLTIERDAARDLAVRSGYWQNEVDTDYEAMRPTDLEALAMDPPLTEAESAAFTKAISE